MYIQIFGRKTCPYCVKADALAKKLVEELNDCTYEFTDMIAEDISKEELSKRLNKVVMTVPQVCVDGKCIGGYTDFDAWVQMETIKGKLDYKNK